MSGGRAEQVRRSQGARKEPAGPKQVRTHTKTQSSAFSINASPPATPLAFLRTNAPG